MSIQKNLKYYSQNKSIDPVRFLTLFLLCILFLFTPSLNDIGFMASTLSTKTIFFVHALLIGLGIKTFRIFYKREGGKSVFLGFSKIDLALCALLLWLVGNRYLVQAHHGFSLRFIDLVGLTFLYVMLRFVMVKDLFFLGVAIIISGMIQAVYGNLQLLGYYPSLHVGFAISGSYFNPGPYAGFLSAVWPVALGMYLFREKITAHALDDRKKISEIRLKVVNKIFTYIPFMGMVTIILVLPATRSRAAWLSVLVSTLFLASYKYKLFHKTKTLTPIKKLTLSMLALLLIGCGLYSIYHFKKGSADGRILIWKVTSNIIKENPLFGVGYDRFKAYYMDAQAAYFQKKGETEEAMVADNTNYAFNEILQFIAENGVIGLLLAFCMLLFVMWLKSPSNMSFLKTIGVGTLMGTFVFGLFSYPAQILPIKMIGVFALAMLAATDTGKINRKHFFTNGNGVGFQKMKLLLKVMVSILFIIGIWYSYGCIGKIKQGYEGWKIAMDTYNYGFYEDSVTEFEKVYPILQNEGDFLMNYGKALVMAERPEKAVKILMLAREQLNNTIVETSLGDAHKILQNYNASEAAYQNAALMIPIRFYPHYLLAKLYNESGQEEKAVKKAREVLAKEVKVNSTAIKEIKAEMKKIVGQ